MLTLIVDILSWVCFIVGGFFLFVGSLGMVRLVDFWARLHAASIIDSAGVGLILLGMMLQGGLSLVTAKLALIVLFLFITGPTASHAVANAAFMSGSRPHEMVEDVTAEPPKPAKAPRAKSKTSAAKTRKTTKTTSKASAKPKTKSSAGATKAATTKAAATKAAATKAAATKAAATKSKAPAKTKAPAKSASKPASKTRKKT